jgi:murein DD-endopeptidase MepM/ murein hydrolase activator NlpD
MHMAKKYTILVIDDQGKPIRESRCSKATIRVFAAATLIMVALLGVGIYRYVSLHQSIADERLMQTQLAQQIHQIESQNKQIQSFAENINEIKSSLLSLNDFEQKIRIMANLEHKGDQADLFAIGGSMPEDLDTQIALKEDHDILIRQMHEQVDQIEQVAAIQKNSFDSLVKSLDGKRNLLAATPSLRPTRGWISSEFGYRISPFTAKRELHKGLDIANRHGTPIIAPADGVVTYAKKRWLMGNMVTIDHGYGMVTRYGHVDKFKIKTGDRVKRGEVIALMGNTGRSTGPHLHYEVLLNSVPVDPKRYILD